MKTKRTSFEGANLHVTVTRVSEESQTGYDIEAKHINTSETVTSLWLDSIEDMVALTEALESYLEMQGIRKEFRHG